MGRKAGRSTSDGSIDDKEGEAGLLRVDFEPDDEADLEPISWEDFFEKFDKEDLTFLYQEKTASGELSRFHKFIDRERWSRFLRQVAKVDSMTRRKIHHEDAKTVHSRVQGEGRA
jgi:hypothetical protein